MATALTAALLSKGSVSIVHVGDSRAYLWRRGTLRQLTADHTLGAALFGQGRIDRTEAAEGPVRSVLMRALGAQNGEVDVAGSATLPGDRLVLCSDGLHSMVDDDSIARVVGNPGSPQQACERLVRLANDAGGLDNVTVVVVAFECWGFERDLLGSREGRETRGQGDVRARGTDAAMITWFCPRCFAEIARTDAVCPECGAPTDDRNDYEQSLIRALRHRLSDRRVLAANILGHRRSSRAVPDLIEIANDPSDPYLACEAAEALARIGGPEADAALRDLAESGDSSMLRGVAREQLDRLSEERRRPRDGSAERRLD